MLHLHHLQDKLVEPLLARLDETGVKVVAQEPFSRQLEGTGLAEFLFELLMKLVEFIVPVFCF